MNAREVEARGTRIQAQLPGHGQQVVEGAAVCVSQNPTVVVDQLQRCKATQLRRRKLAAQFGEGLGQCLLPGLANGGCQSVQLGAQQFHRQRGAFLHRRRDTLALEPLGGAADDQRAGQASEHHAQQELAPDRAAADVHGTGLGPGAGQDMASGGPEFCMRLILHACFRARIGGRPSRCRRTAFGEHRLDLFLRKGLGRFGAHRLQSAFTSARVSHMAHHPLRSKQS